MPFDTWGSQLEGQIGDLDQFIQWVEMKNPDDIVGNHLLQYLTCKRDSLQRQLDQHRRRDAESGIKY